jgi:hypothetical protein
MNRFASSLNDERSRRQFIADAAKALLGVGIAPWAGSLLAGDSPGVAPRRARADSVIYLNMIGGVSHIDTFDPKPEVPEIQGPVAPLATNVPGIHLTENLPRLAQQMDQFALIRSMTSNQGDHAAAQYLLHRSYLEGGTISHPTLAAWAMHSAEKLNPELPGAASIGSNDDSLSTGFLDLKYSPVPIGDPAQGIADSKLPKYVKEGNRLPTRLALTQAFNESFHGRYHYRQTEAHAKMFVDAVRLMRSNDLKAFDISKETPAMRAEYGASPFGQGCLLARRLVEYGLRFVEVGFGGWDTHFDNFGVVAKNANILDQALSTLLYDLNQRGLLDSTLVVLATEFGRTPTIVEAHKNGRDHHPTAFSCVVAGGGVNGGQAYGATDAKGARVVDRKVSIPDLNATIGWALGLPIDEKFTASTGQQFQIASDGKPIAGLFA